MKILISLGLLVVAAIIGFIALLPSTNYYTINKKVDCTENGAGRLIVDSTKWQQWWPGQKGESNKLQIDDYSYRIDRLYITGFAATVFHKNDSAKLLFTCQEVKPGQSNFQWQTVTNFSKSLFTRFSENFAFKSINRNVSRLADSMSLFFNKPENIYGLKIQEQVVKDTTMIAMKDTLNHYPTVAETYSLIDSIKAYIKSSGGEMHNHPMLNVYQELPGLFYLMTAIPTNKDLPASGPFLLKKMIRGYILTAQVKGGILQIKKAEEALAAYASDYKKLSPAIPYQSLTVDRNLQPDSSKWITTLYYPVFY